MKNFCDLHTHSVYSDGTATPREIIDEAERLGLSAVAMTDHNTVLGLENFLSCAEGSTVRAIPGIEMSTNYEGVELHIVGLFLPRRSFPIIDEALRLRNEKKTEANIELVDALRRGGYLIDYNEILQAAEGYINRAHIAKALMEKGYVSSIKEAFETLLSEKNGFYNPPQRIGVFEAIDFLHYCRAVTVLAHPFLDLKTTYDLCEFLDKAKEVGLDAMETHYSLFSKSKTAIASEIAEHYGIAESGGSDFHGANKPDISLGVGRGELRVPASFAMRLEELI